MNSIEAWLAINNLIQSVNIGHLLIWFFHSMIFSIIICIRDNWLDGELITNFAHNMLFVFLIVLKRWIIIFTYFNFFFNHFCTGNFKSLLFNIFPAFNRVISVLNSLAQLISDYFDCLLLFRVLLFIFHFYILRARWWVRLRIILRWRLLGILFRRWAFFSWCGGRFWRRWWRTLFMNLLFVLLLVFLIALVTSLLLHLSCLGLRYLGLVLNVLFRNGR